MKLITGHIDVTKIDKSKLFKGKKGTYLDIVLIQTPDNQYGNDYMIVQSAPKDEKGAILGNATIYKKKDDTEPKNDTHPEIDSLGDDEQSGLPF